MGPKPLPSTRTIPLGLLESIEKLWSAGYEYADVNYANLEREGVDDTLVLTYFRAALQEALRLGIKPLTLHMPWENYFLIYLGKGVSKAIDEARLLLDIAYGYGVEIVVFHPFSSQRLGESRVIWFNKRFFASLAEYAESEGLSVIAVENAEKARPWTSVDAVARLVSSINSKKLGVCFDTGHAHLNGYSIAKADKALSRTRVVCLHVHDNNGVGDQHSMPGCGTINWSEAREAKSLKKSPYAVAEVDCRADIGTCLERVKLSLQLIERIFG